MVVCDLDPPAGRQMRGLGRTGWADRAQAMQTEPLTGRVADLEAANADLSAWLIWRNSGTSPIPPSADDPSARRLPGGADFAAAHLLLRLTVRGARAAPGILDVPSALHKVPLSGVPREPATRTGPAEPRIRPGPQGAWILCPLDSRVRVVSCGSSGRQGVDVSRPA